MNTYIFFYKPMMRVYFVLYAGRYYEAVIQMESLMGPEKLWVDDFIVLQNGQKMAS